MTALFFDIKRFAVHDGPGIRTTFFMQGCPLSCWWCHNPESRPVKPQESSSFRTFALSVDQLLSEAEKDSIFFEESGGGITFSGGEPTAQLPFLKKAAKVLKRAGFHVTLDTTGFFPAGNAKEMAQLFDLILFDIKHLDSDLHEKYTGVDNKLILENLDSLMMSNANIRLRMPFIPEINAMREHLEQLASIAAKYSLPVDLLPYHRIAGHKYEKLGLEHEMKAYSEPSENELSEAKRFLEKQDIQVNIGG
ncbi:MAG: glycyl-radical enzyme activating protein [Bacteroidota bacterium]